MTPAAARTAILTASAVAAGWLARNEAERRRRGHGAAYETRMRSAFHGPGGWALGGVRRILDAAEADDVAESVIVRFTSPHGGDVLAQIERGQDHPQLMFLAQTGECSWAAAALDTAPDDLSGLGDAV